LAAYVFSSVAAWLKKDTISCIGASGFGALSFGNGLLNKRERN
jgi:hypothetical protein